jgi:gas vesicle protein
MSEKQGSSYFNGFFFGGVLGAVLGLLFAPETGDEVREKVKAKIDALQQDSEGVVAEMKEVSTKIINQTKESMEIGFDKLSLAIEEAKRAAQEKRAELENELPGAEQNKRA